MIEVNQENMQRLAEKQPQTAFEREMAHRAAEQWAAGMMQKYVLREQDERRKKRNPLNVSEQVIGMRLHDKLSAAGWNRVQGWGK